MTNVDRHEIGELTEEEYRKAFVEVAFLLNAFAFTIDTIMGGNTAPAGRMAGRDTAEKLPLELDHPDLPTVVATLAQHEQFASGFDISIEGDELRFGKCVIREMCALHKHDPGSPPCKLFHSYFDGVVNGLLERPVKSTFRSLGDQCALQIVAQ